MRGIDNKKGLSTIVATLIIILLVLVSAGIIWVVVRNVIQGEAEQINLNKLTIALNIEKVQFSGDNVSVTVKRNQGKGEFTGIAFVFDDGENSEEFTEYVSMKELEIKTFTFTLTEIDIENLEKLKIYPIFELKSGKEMVGDVKDEYKFSSTCSPICPSGAQCGFNGCGGTCGLGCLDGYTCQTDRTCLANSCTPTTCVILEHDCGIWPDGCPGGGTITCGSYSGGCQTGYNCQTNGTCTPTICTDTCASLGFDCGTQLVCGVPTVCGSYSGGCQTGYNCMLNGTCIIQCVLSSARWSTTSASIGDPVELIIQGTNCEGREISFEVWEIDGPSYPDDPAVTFPPSIIFSGTTSHGTWIAESQNDIDPLEPDQTNPPEYYFIAYGLIGASEITVTPLPYNLTVWA